MAVRDAAILTDLTRCIACGACALACKEINGLPRGGMDRLTATTWTIVEKRQGVGIRRQCMHCLDPTCASVCPVKALEKTPEGPVVYHEDRCIGCRYCIMACPFEIPKYEWDEPLAPRVQKCIFCYSKRLSKGEEPACTSVCPTRATIFGNRGDLITEARRRIRENPGRYVDHIYGLEEAGGTSVLYLSDIPFERLGFKALRKGKAYPPLTGRVLSQIPDVISVGGVLLLGVWWIMRRRDSLARGRGKDEGE